MYSNRILDVCLRKLQAPSIIKATAAHELRPQQCYPCHPWAVPTPHATTATHELCPHHTLPLPPMGCAHTIPPLQWWYWNPSETVRKPFSHLELLKQELDYRGTEVTTSPPKDGHLFSPQSLVAMVELDSSFFTVLGNSGEVLVRKVFMSLAFLISSPLVREKESSLGHFYLNMAVFSGCCFLRGQIWVM